MPIDYSKLSQFKVDDKNSLGSFDSAYSPMFTGKSILPTYTTQRIAFPGDSKSRQNVITGFKNNTHPTATDYSNYYQLQSKPYSELGDKYKQQVDMFRKEYPVNIKGNSTLYQFDIPMQNNILANNQQQGTTNNTGGNQTPTPNPNQQQGNLKRPGLIKNLFGWTDARGTHYNPTWQSYAPLLSNAFNLGEAIFKKPDFSPLDEIDYDAMFAYANGLMQQPPHINATMEYKPIDKNYYLNRNNSQYGALMNNARQTSGGNAAANFAQSLMADRQMQNSNADIMRHAEEMNWDRYKTAKEFNKDVEQQNAANALHWMQQIVPLQTQKFDATKFKVQKKLEMLDEWKKQRLQSQANVASYLKEIGDRNREFNMQSIDYSWRSPNGGVYASNLKPSYGAGKYVGAYAKPNKFANYDEVHAEAIRRGYKIDTPEYNNFMKFNLPQQQ